MLVSQSHWVALAACLFLTGEATAALQVVEICQEGNLWTCTVRSEYLGDQATSVRILQPGTTAWSRSGRFLYVLPVEAGVTDSKSRNGDGLEEARRLDLHNRYNVTVVAPSFSIVPWYGDHASDSTRRLESFLVRDLVPWIDRLAPPCEPAERWLVGFSKSGHGALTLVLRNAGVFAAAAAWDAPALVADLSRIEGLQENFGTAERFAEYHLPRLVQDQGDAFQMRNRLWISGDQSAWTADMQALHEQLSAAGILHDFATGQTRDHHWCSGWLEQGVRFFDSHAVTSPRRLVDHGAAIGEYRRYFIQRQCHLSILPT